MVISNDHIDAIVNEDKRGLQLLVSENVSRLPFLSVSLLVNHVGIDGHHEREVIKCLINPDEFRVLLHDVKEIPHERERIDLVRRVRSKSDLLSKLSRLSIVGRVNHQVIIVFQEGERDLVREEPVLVGLLRQRQRA